MNYQETVDYLFARLPMFQRDGAAALKPGLQNIISLCDLLGNPQHEFKTIHIAGTNGKGSTSNFLASIFQEAGYKTGLFTSPHIKDFRERIRINGEMIGEQEVVSFVEKHKTEFEKINSSFFEYTTALAFWYFNESKVDIAIIETGLGGRLDSTNIVIPEISIITSVSMDHTYLLGNTIEEIAGEKAGIIKENVPIILAPNTPQVFAVVERIAKEKQSDFYSAGGVKVAPGIKIGLEGAYQQENIAVVLKSVEVLKKLGWKLDGGSVSEGLKNVVTNTGFRGRWEMISRLPDVICDVAHNEDGIRWVVKQLKQLEYNQLHIVFGIVQDKSVDDLMQLLPKDAVYYFCNAPISRALPADKLKEAGDKNGLKGERYSSVNEALDAAKKASKETDVIFVGGSVFVVGEVLK